jgi:ABC-type sugar transport system ATPase subunit
MTEYVLETVNLTKSFPGVVALRDVNLKIEKGTIHALVGENGAGKSTLIHLLMGAYQPDYGDIILNGKKMDFHSPLDATHSGISAVFQELSVVANMSIAENIFINRQPVNKLGMVQFNKMYRETRNLLKLFEINTIDPKTLVGDLSMANRQLVEILKAMSYDPQVLVLDEPTSSLTDTEVNQLFANIRRLNERGVTFIIVSHHLNEIFEIANTLTVFRDGKHICDAKVSDVDEQFLISNMVGRTLGNIFGKRESRIGSPSVEVKNISRQGSFKNVSFTVAQGEIVGFYGLIGAGRTEVGRAIFGLEPVESGTIIIDGEQLLIKNPSDAMKKIGYVTEDRKQLGLFLNHPIKTNIVSNKLQEVSTNVLINEKRIIEKATNATRSFNIIANDINQKVMTLSGGNQQKVLLAEWFDMNLKFLIVDEPTRGVDVGARNDIYNHIRHLAEKGTAVMLISSDLLEILAMSDRIVVMRGGEISGEISRQEATEQKVLSYAMGV